MGISGIVMIMGLLSLGYPPSKGEYTMSLGKAMVETGMTPMDRWGGKEPISSILRP